MLFFWIEAQCLCVACNSRVTGHQNVAYLLSSSRLLRWGRTNAACAAADPAMAAFYHMQCVVTRGRAVEYRGRSGIGVEVRVFMNMNGEIEFDIKQECRSAARALVRRAVLAALTRQL